MMLLITAAMLTARAEVVRVGAKTFTEAFVLGEWLAHEIERTEPVARRFGLGGTGILFAALREGEVDLYVEYTGTIAEAILRAPHASADEMRAGLEKNGLVMSESLGFRNDYALAVTKDFARGQDLVTIADLARAGDFARPAFSYEFIERRDGLRGLAEVYGLHGLLATPGMEHALAFEALTNGRANVMDVYTTDAKIDRLGLKVLRDDKNFFPRYDAVILARRPWVEAHPQLWARLGKLAGTLSAKTVRGWNARVDLDGLDARAAIGAAAHQDPPSWWSEVERRAQEHALLVGVALVISIAFGIPLGVLAYYFPRVGRVILIGSGTIQTIPSLALLCFLIPVTGIGTRSALVALCLYGLLPIVSNTLLGLQSIDPGLLEMARALKLTVWQRLWHIELPLASRAILAGVRTSAVIGIGTATLAALIGAGGFGATIMAGLAVNDVRLIWAGALPAAGMALVVQALFAGLGMIVIPRGLRGSGPK